jgi:hypothetical protein
MLKWSHVPGKLEEGCQSGSDTMFCDNKQPTAIGRICGIYRLTLGILLRFLVYLRQFLQCHLGRGRKELTKGVGERSNKNSKRERAHHISAWMDILTFMYKVIL